MYYYEIPWFYQDFKSENLCTQFKQREVMRSRGHVNSFQMRNKIPLQL